MGLISIDNERNILNQIANNDEQAFVALFNGYVQQTGKIVFAITGSKVQTEEIVQDVFLKVWNERAKLPEIKKFNSYLFILLRNHTINYINKQITERKHQAQYANYVEQTELAPDTAPMAEHLEKAIDRLPTQQKTVFLLRAQGYRVQQAAHFFHRRHPLRRRENHADAHGLQSKNLVVEQSLYEQGKDGKGDRR
ncbi:sigma-70 family RNA polymerase sigma factor [Chitinophaga sp. CB10]|uniref:RNA polymerase sigma factor n=1 Tax=Chitinophaga sp. CB10 TaxID=1891659 RepID=UPI0025BC7A35|nr:sigma-70 family RNA polymerase sigma factor [Chitinophaga sp. CB10]